MSKKTKSSNVEGIVPIALNMGDELVDLWNETQDLKVAQTALAAYNMAIKSTQIQIINKKLTGKPNKIKLLSN